ncbi:MAG: aldo/keto reductase [Lentilactobacillus diolivorans]|nr:aldo/keto reductase [Lentilactobacillus diolivorans]RRG03348.1 MAG: aldo/keto reductase [Lactobacillus sp.]
MDTVTLNNGVKMPQLGLGVFQISDYDVAKQSVLDGIKNGYRLIDTAAAYRNESAVGAAIKESGIDRKKLFVTSKLWVQDMSYEGAKQGFQTSLDNLGLDYIDLYLLHQPVGDTFGAWRALEEFYQAGKIRAIGVSNFDSAQLANLIAFNKVTPAVNQVELHVFNQKPEAIDYMRSKGVQPEAWAPFAEGKHHIFTQPLLKNIGDKYGKTPSQVALRWLLQRHVVAIPKSTHENRLIQNLDVFDFQLSADDMKEIATLDIGHSEIVNHQDPKFIEMLAGMRIHD